MALGRLGKYERVDVLGHGASGIVYLAWDTLLKKQIALKEIDVQGADVSRFLEEARVMDRLNHPNIVRVNGVDRIEGHIVIDMEYVKGKNLQELLRTEGCLPPDRAIDVAIQTLDALDYAHRMRTVHRDIKPANILLSRTGEVKLVDFGLAEILATNSYAGGAGTYAYMAPEDFEEEHQSDHRSDIWAVGVTLYEMLTGARPFYVARPKDPFTWRRVLQNDPAIPLSEHLPDASPALQAALDRALAKDKYDRYATAGEFRDDLQALRHGHVSTLAPVSNGHRPEQEERPLRPVVVGGGAGSATVYPPDPTPPKGLNGARLAFSGGESTLIPTVPLPLSAAPPTPARQEPEARPPAKHAPETPEKPGRRLRLPSLRREVQPAHVSVAPETVHFGEVRKGDERTTKVRVVMEGGTGKMTGRVATAPPWLTVSPVVFTHRRQTLTLTAHSERVWQTGDYEDVIRVETTAGEVQFPVALRVLKARPRFSDVALWFLPLFLMVLLPALTVAWGAQFPAARHLVPAAALGSGLLAAMLLLVSFEADLGFAEKLACGVLLAVMAMVLGVTIGISGRMGQPENLHAMPATGVPIGLILICQLSQRKHWKLWAGAIVVLALLAVFTFANTLTGRM